MILKTAMILAAGRGERLRPLTRYHPKAMTPVNGAPLIEHHLVRLAQAGFTRVVINHAYLGDQIRRYLENSKGWGLEIVYSPEPPGGLETGGGIYNALALLGNKPFMTINADLYSTLDFSTIQLPESSIAHLVLGKKPLYAKQGDYGLTKANQLTNDKDHTYLGVACYHPLFFQLLGYGRYSITPLIRRMIADYPITGEYYSGVWNDIGTLERLAQARHQSIV